MDTRSLSIGQIARITIGGTGGSTVYVGRTEYGVRSICYDDGSPAYLDYHDIQSVTCSLVKNPHRIKNHIARDAVLAFLSP